MNQCLFGTCRVTIIPTGQAGILVTDLSYTSEWVEASWNDAVTWLHSEGLEVMDLPAITFGSQEVYIVYRP